MTERLVLLALAITVAVIGAILMVDLYQSIDIQSILGS